MTHNAKNGFLLLHLSVFIAGFTGVLGRLIELDSGVLVWHRMAWAATLMVLFLAFSKELKSYQFKDILRMGGVGVLLCLHWVFFYASIKASNVSIGVVCFSLVGFFTALFEPIINKHRFSIREFLFSILTVCGVYLIFQFDTRYRLGIVLGIISSALYALFAIANQHVGKLLPTGMDYPYMAFMVVVCTIGLCLLQIIVLQKIDTFTVNLTYNLEPVYSIILAMVIFNEYQELNFSFILGIALIILSVGLQTWSKFKVK